MSDYFIDFTKTTSQPTEWQLANYANVKYAANGAEFTYAKRYDAPQMQTTWKMFFGRVDIVMKAAKGRGIVSGMVLLSSDLDEVDWECTGTMSNNSQIQTNYYGKGIEDYSVGAFLKVDSPAQQFHTYTLDWSPTSLTWAIDGVPLRTVNNAKGVNFPQTPCAVSLSLWAGGDPSLPQGTQQWAGGITPIPPPEPYTMYIKSVKVHNMFPGQQYKYSDRSGSWGSIKVLNDTKSSSLSSIPTSALSATVPKMSIPATGIAVANGTSSLPPTNQITTLPSKTSSAVTQASSGASAKSNSSLPSSGSPESPAANSSAPVSKPAGTGMAASSTMSSAVATSPSPNSGTAASRPPSNSDPAPQSSGTGVAPPSLKIDVAAPKSPAPEVTASHAPSTGIAASQTSSTGVASSKPSSQPSMPGLAASQSSADLASSKPSSQSSMPVVAASQSTNSGSAAPPHVSSGAAAVSSSGASNAASSPKSPAPNDSAVSKSSLLGSGENKSGTVLPTSSGAAVLSVPFSSSGTLAVSKPFLGAFSAVLASGKSCSKKSASSAASAASITGAVKAAVGSLAGVANKTQPTSAFTAGGHAFTPCPGGLAVGNQTISLGGPGVTISNNVVSLGSSGVHIGTSVIPLPSGVLSKGTNTNSAAKSAINGTLTAPISGTTQAVVTTELYV